MFGPSLGRFLMLLQATEVLELTLFFSLTDLDFNWRGNRKQKRHTSSGLVRGSNPCHSCQWILHTGREGSQSHDDETPGEKSRHCASQSATPNPLKHTPAGFSNSSCSPEATLMQACPGDVSFKKQLPLLISRLPLLRNGYWWHKKTIYNHFTSSSWFLITTSDHSRPLLRWSPTPNTAAAPAARKNPAMLLGLCRKCCFPQQLCGERGSYDDNPSEIISAAGDESAVGRSYLYLSDVVSGLTHHFVLPAGSCSIMMQSTLANATERSLECSGRILITANNWHYCVLLFSPYQSTKWPFTK